MKDGDFLGLLSKLADVEYLVADDSVIQALFNKMQTMGLIQIQCLSTRSQDDFAAYLYYYNLLKKTMVGI